MRVLANSVFFLKTLNLNQVKRDQFILIYRKLIRLMRWSYLAKTFFARPVIKIKIAPIVIE